MRQPFDAQKFCSVRIKSWKVFLVSWAFGTFYPFQTKRRKLQSASPQNKPLEMIMRIVRLVALAALVAGPAAALPGTHLLKSVPVGGDTFWDAITLDDVHHHLFLTHGS